MLGYQVGELDGTTLQQVVYPADQELTNSAITGLHQDMDGVAVTNWVEWQMILFQHLIYTSSRDISPRKDVEEQLQAGITMLVKNQETLVTLNDQIRNPLTIISICAEEVEDEMVRMILGEVKRIDDILDQLDRGWIESDKVRRVMKRYLEE